MKSRRRICLSPSSGPRRRLLSLDDKGITFKWKDYRLEGPERYQVMTLDTHEFIRRFLMHVLPSGFHRIRYYGFLTSQTRARNIARIRELLAVPLIPIDATVLKIDDQWILTAPLESRRKIQGVGLWRKVT